MNVKELIEKLKTLDQALPVVCYYEDDNEVCLMELDHVDASDAKITRNDDGSISGKFERGPESQKVAFIHVTCG